MHPRYPDYVGIRNNGIITLIRKERTFYSWPQLNFNAMSKNWPRVGNTIDLEQFFGKTYGVKQEILRAIIQKYKELYPNDEIPIKSDFYYSKR
jgi:hypothetical protein